MLSSIVCRPWHMGTNDRRQLPSFNTATMCELMQGHYRRGQALAALGRLAEAQQAYEEVLRIDQNAAQVKEHLEELKVRGLRPNNNPNTCIV